jgi:NAD(P)-dependent dehydrogenase (short-subunit alcohol dehydrogenase family)
MRELHGQAAVVTGAADCIGEAMAQRLASIGARGALRTLTMGQ